jgi:hypothetical protein
VTPDLQAARDRVAAFLTQRTPELHDRVAYAGAGRDAAVLFASDLRALLAASDPAEQPIDHVPTQRALDYLRDRRQQHPKEPTDA